jgi:hypothetical protein
MADRPIDVVDTVRTGYAFTGPALELRALVVDGQPVVDAQVRIPLSMTNRHGLVAGASGTEKTRTLQVLAEQLSAHGVPVFARLTSRESPRQEAAVTGCPRAAASSASQHVAAGR